MHPFFDVVAFPWHRKDAQELYRELVDVIRSFTAIDLLYRESAPGLPAIPNVQTDDVWTQVLDKLTGARALKRLCQLIADDPRYVILRPVIATIQDAASLTEPPLLGPGSYLFCRLVCDYNGTPAFGTGSRIGPDLLLTNWHVLHHPKLDIRATAVTAQFAYEQDELGNPLKSIDIACDVGSIVVGDSKNDWGVIRVATALPDTIPTIKLSDAVAPAVNAPAFVVQHPNGAYKRIGYVRNQVTAFDDQFLYYLTDTQAGSSGSPVFDDKCRLIGLHHFGGTPQEVAGRQPLKKNRGVRIPRVIAGLQTAKIAVQ